MTATLLHGGMHVQAIGRYLLQDVDGGRFCKEHFIACQQLLPASDFAVLTASHLLSIHSPGLRFLPSLIYSVALEDIVFLRRYLLSCLNLQISQDLEFRCSFNRLNAHSASDSLCCAVCNAA